METNDLPVWIPDVPTMQRALDACTDPTARAAIARAIANPDDQGAWDEASWAITNAGVQL